MSLPFYAKFLDVNGVLIGNYFVNIGWSVNKEAMVRCLSELCRIEHYANPNTVNISLYYYTFPKELLQDCSGLKISEAVKVIGAYMDQQDLLIK